MSLDMSGMNTEWSGVGDLLDYMEKTVEGMEQEADPRADLLEDAGNTIMLLNDLRHKAAAEMGRALVEIAHAPESARVRIRQLIKELE